MLNIKNHIKQPSRMPAMPVAAALMAMVLQSTSSSVSATNPAEAFEARRAAVMLTPAKRDSTSTLGVAVAGERLVAVGIQGLIVTSEDKGRTWRQAAAPSDVTLTSVAFSTPETGFAVGHEETILRTDDGGLTWVIVATEPGGVPLLRIRFFNTEQGLAVGGGGAVLSTLDGGVSWRKSTVVAEDGDFDPQLFDVAKLDDGRLLLVGEAGHLFRSADAGSHWEELESPYNGTFFGVVNVGKRGLLAYGMLGNLFQSSDGGDTWVKMDSGVDQSFFDAITNGGSVYIGGGDGVLLRIDRSKPYEITLRIIDGRPSISGGVSISGRLVITSDRGIRLVDLH